MPASASSALVLGQKELYATGRFSDLTINCRGTDFKVHRYCLYTQSSVFRKLLGGDFKEASTGQAVIPVDDEPQIFKAFLFYLYNFHIDGAHGDTSVSPFTVKLYAVADKYDLKSLQEVAALKLDNVCDPTTNLEDFIAGLVAIDECTAPNDPTLWNVVIPKIKRNITFLLASEQFRALVQDMPDLNLKLLAQLDPAGKSPPPVSTPAYGESLGAAGRAPEHGDDDDEEDDQTIHFNRTPARPMYRGVGRRLGDA